MFLVGKVLSLFRSPSPPSTSLSISRSLALPPSLLSLFLFLSHAREFRTLKSRSHEQWVPIWYNGWYSSASEETGLGGESPPSLGNTCRDKLPHPCGFCLVSALTCFSSACVYAVMSVCEVYVYFGIRGKTQSFQWNERRKRRKRERTPQRSSRLTLLSSKTTTNGNYPHIK